MATKGPKDRAKTEETMQPRASRRSGLKLLHRTEPSAGEPGEPGEPGERTNTNQKNRLPSGAEPHLGGPE